MAQLSTRLPLDLMQTRWAATLNPVLSLPMLDGNKIDGIKLVAGIPQVINHLLQRTPQGWFLMDNTADTSVWRTADFNNLTITLQSSVDTTISFWIF